MKNNSEIGSSFKDPSGFVFFHNGEVYRQINKEYQSDYDRLVKSGLCEVLVKANLLVPHEEAEIPSPDPQKCYKILHPRNIGFVSYPYEWCFSQLKDAALTTLRIQKEALKCGMSLKDASAYNIQFCDGSPLLIDTLSFEKYEEGTPWIAYRQFCRHFLAPLALMSLRNIFVTPWLKSYLDGLPLDLTSTLLPFRSCFKLGLLFHIHLHAAAEKHFSSKKVEAKNVRMGLAAFHSLLKSLEVSIEKMKWDPGRTEWRHYYQDTNYTETAMNQKKEIVRQAIKECRPANIWDLGCNLGVFSYLAADDGIPVVTFDQDQTVVDAMYAEIRSKKETRILPLWMDLTNPSPSLGWNHNERMSLIDRGPADLLLALALVHHLRIGNNLPFDKISEFFSKICRNLIIEFIPKEDSQVVRLLANRKDIFSDYSQQAFESNFEKNFSIKKRIPMAETHRLIYAMANKTNLQ